MPPRGYSYDRVAWCYDGVAAAYSLGAIGAAKRSHLCELRPGQRVLYAGVGCGEEALRAVRAGVRVTGVDRSPRMLHRFRSALERESLDAELVCGDVSRHRAPVLYDGVVANFFLNLFGEAELKLVLAHLMSMLRPGGKLMVADFAPPGGGRLARSATALNFRPLNWSAWLLRLCALHPVYDYAARFEAPDLRVVARRSYRPFFAAPELYQALVFQRGASSQAADSFCAGSASAGSSYDSSSGASASDASASVGSGSKESTSRASPS